MAAVLKRGEVWLIELDPAIGYEIKKTRPAIVVQNDSGNQNSEITIVVPLTSKHIDKIYPFEVLLTPENSGVSKPSRAVCNQMRAIDKVRCRRKVGRVSTPTMLSVDSALKFALGLN